MKATKKKRTFKEFIEQAGATVIITKLPSNLAGFVYSKNKDVYLVYNKDFTQQGARKRKIFENVLLQHYAGFVESNTKATTDTTQLIYRDMVEGNRG